LFLLFFIFLLNLTIDRQIEQLSNHFCPSATGYQDTQSHQGVGLPLWSVPPSDDTQLGGTGCTIPTRIVGIEVMISPTIS